MSNTSVDDFQLYNAALSADQINALYLTGATTHGALPTTTPLQVAAHAILDLNGVNQRVASLSDISGSGGTVQEQQHGHGLHADPQRHRRHDHLQRQYCRRQRLGHDQPGDERQRSPSVGRDEHVHRRHRRDERDARLRHGQRRCRARAFSPSRPAATWRWARCWGPRRLRSPPAIQGRPKRRPTAAVWRRRAATPATVERHRRSAAMLPAARPRRRARSRYRSRARWSYCWPVRPRWPLRPGSGGSLCVEDWCSGNTTLIW